jgi:hypothetical protein
VKSYPRICSVQALPGKKLRVGFNNGDIRLYDCRPLLKEEPFKALQDEALFRLARAEQHGYAVIWNNDIDLAESEVWIHGRTEGDAADLSRLHRLAAKVRKSRSSAKAGASVRGGHVPR